MIISICEQKCWNVKDGWWREDPLPFAYTLYGVLFFIRVCTKRATDFLENFQAKIDIFKANFLNTISFYM